MRYVLFPGYVTSRSDGQRHFISGKKLAGLYGVEYRKCLVIQTYHSHRHYGVGLDDDVRLFPQSSGDYSL